MNENTIKEWKKIHGKIFKTKIDGEEYIYRTLTVGECSKIFAKTQEDSDQDVTELTFVAVLFPEKFDAKNVSCGVAESLSNIILESTKIFSADSLTKLLVETQQRITSEANNDLFKWKLAILKTFPGYTPTDLDKMSIDQFFDILMLVEFLTDEKLINYEKLAQNNAEIEEKLEEIPVPEQAVASANKFVSKNELEQIAMDEATKNLREHMMSHRVKSKRRI